jgi:hypothetical protein
MSLSDQVGKNVTIEGTAKNAAAGAVVMTDDGPLYVSGVESWDKATNGKKVSITGTVRAKDGGKMQNDQGEHIHGIPGEHFVIESATWALAGN